MSVTIELVGGPADGKIYAIPELIDRYTVIVSGGLRGGPVMKVVYVRDGKRINVDGRHLYRLESMAPF